MERDGNSTNNNSLLDRYMQKVQDREREIRELSEMVIMRDREITQLRSQLQGQARSTNNLGSNHENMNQIDNEQNPTLNINPQSTNINNREVDQLRQEVVGSYQ